MNRHYIGHLSIVVIGWDIKHIQDLDLEKAEDYELINLISQMKAMEEVAEDYDLAFKTYRMNFLEDNLQAGSSKSKECQHGAKKIYTENVQQYEEQLERKILYSIGSLVKQDTEDIIISVALQATDEDTAPLSKKVVGSKKQDLQEFRLCWDQR